MMLMFQMVLLLCVGGSVAQDVLSPIVNIIEELEKLKNMEERIKALEETMNKVVSENEDKKIAFSAALLASGSGQTGPFDTSKTLTYKKVFSNIGDAYDSNTGIFTAPVKGVYYFRFYAHNHAGRTSAVSLFKNSQTQCAVHTSKPTTNGNASNGIVLTLEKDDQVYTQLWEKTWVYDDANSYTSFSGFILFTL
ncbi:complement component 1, q subcomponent-like 4 like isoform X1 [Xyrauchen texanus]|uniref:complement component 1, q subcomponent-like 4 like isoform X1 n=1 Tax=Xyrauchen texanus TaxID=154827 RepID=UPI0022427AB6|nr:complement component 1, q subcomponent-like 4 like isoform X1 [Xyrauchen texanus]